MPIIWFIRGKLFKTTLKFVSDIERWTDLSGNFMSPNLMFTRKSFSLKYYFTHLWIKLQLHCRQSFKTENSDSHRIGGKTAKYKVCLTFCKLVTIVCSSVSLMLKSCKDSKTAGKSFYFVLRINWFYWWWFHMYICIYMYEACSLPVSTCFLRFD